MKIECVQPKLAEALRKAERVAGKNAALPILSSVLLIAEKGILTVRSTNLELGIEISLPVSIEEEGTAAVSAQAFSSYVSSVRGKKIVLESDEKTLTVISEKQKATFNAYDSSEFPTIPQVDGTAVSLNAESIRDGVRSVIYSASVSSIKPELSSVYIYSNNDNHLVFVATDGFRLAEKKISEKSAQSVDPILIPHKNILEIERLLEGVDGEVEVVFGDNQMALTAGSVYVTSRVVDGSFPDYTKIIPEGFSTKIVALKQDLIDVFKISNIFSGKFNQVTFDIDPKEGLLSLETRSSEVGENKAEVDAHIEGEPLSVNFNYRYITDCFQAINGESIELLFNGVSRPLVLRDPSDKDFTYIVMPMNK